MEQGNAGGISGVWLVFPAFLLSCTRKNGQRQVDSGAVKKMNIDGYILANLCTHLSELGSGKVYTR